MNELSRSIAPKIDHELANKYLKTLILERCGGDINIAREDLASMGSFKTNLQENYSEFCLKNMIDYSLND